MQLVPTDTLWRQHYVSTSKEYLINCHILLQCFELVFLPLQQIQILCKLIIIWVNYEEKKKRRSFYETPCIYPAYRQIYEYVTCGWLPWNQDQLRVLRSYRVWVILTCTFLPGEWSTPWTKWPKGVWEKSEKIEFFVLCGCEERFDRHAWLQ